ncbi:hypothetical protein SDC9_139218 [bioreactor metagenome]|uniref:Uncharacterized protein n=1 Tax=bioreactor metagenome TaxID=1076179 RepID=A0A645DRI2_9ZZZZ
MRRRITDVFNFLSVFFKIAGVHAFKFMFISSTQCFKRHSFLTIGNFFFVRGHAKHGADFFVCTQFQHKSTIAIAKQICLTDRMIIVKTDVITKRHFHDCFSNTAVSWCIAGKN